MYKKFCKSDLFRTVAIVELRNGARYLLEEDKMLCNDASFISLKEYTDDLKAICAGVAIPELDVVKVFEANPYPSIISVNTNRDYKCTLLWERKYDVREMTLEEIEAELGYNILLVSHH